MSGPELTLYFDGTCAFCAIEMARLKSWDKAARLAFVDIADSSFDPAPLGVDLAALNRELHSRTADGRLLVGIDSMLAVYTLVNRAWLVAPLRIGFLRPPLASLYRLFARHRYSVSRWLRIKPPVRCSEGVCQPGGAFMKR